MEEQNEELRITPIDANVIYQQDKAMIDMQISTAKAFPRSIKRSTENAISIVTMDKETAQSCNYALPRAGKTITGPSVHLAKILVQTWGNLRAETKVIEENDKHVTSQAICFDLESNVAIKVEVKRSILTRTGRMSDDMITVTGNAANSIALRNAVFSVIPRSVVDKVYKAALGTITGDISDKDKLITKRKQVFDALKETYKVTEEQILNVIGKASIDHIGQEELVTLIGLGQAIKDGDTTIDEAFKSNKVVKKTAPEKEAERMELLIKSADNIEALKAIEKQVKPEQMSLFNSKLDELKGTANK